MSTDHRIPVKEGTHKDLHGMKVPGQTYDELLQELINERRQKEAAADIKATLERAEDFDAMHELMKEDNFEEAWEMMDLSPEEADELAREWYEMLMGEKPEQA